MVWILLVTIILISNLIYLSTVTLLVYLNIIYLFMPLQQDGAAVFWRPLEAFVDVFHQQVYAVLVEWLHAFLDVTALKGAEHLQHQTLCTILGRQKTSESLPTSQIYIYTLQYEIVV